MKRGLTLKYSLQVNDKRRFETQLSINFKDTRMLHLLIETCFFCNLAYMDQLCCISVQTHPCDFFFSSYCQAGVFGSGKKHSSSSHCSFGCGRAGAALRTQVLNLFKESLYNLVMAVECFLDVQWYACWHSCCQNHEWFLSCHVTSALSPLSALCRDLHWGNVLVKPTKQKQSSFLLNGVVRSVDTSGVLVRIIDYSLSRLEIGQAFSFLFLDAVFCEHKSTYGGYSSLPRRWPDRVLRYIKGWGALHGAGGLSVWDLPTNEETKWVSVPDEQAIDQHLFIQLNNGSFYLSF